MPNQKLWVYSLISAFLLSIAWPPVPYTSPLLAIALVPLLLVFERIKTDSPKSRKAYFKYAFLTFFTWNTISIYWVYNAIDAASTNFLGHVVSLLVSLIPFGLGALIMTTAFWLYGKLSEISHRYLAYLALISFYLAGEYLHQSWDLAFPWMNLGNGFAGLHQLVQWYEYTGVYGGSLWILLSNILIFEVWKNRSLKTNWKLIGISIIWLLAPAAYSLYTYNKYEEKSVPTHVAVIQPNIDPYGKFGEISPASQLETLIRLSDSVAKPYTEYFIWPETALPIYADEAQIRSYPEIQRTKNFLSQYKNASLITGIESIKWYKNKSTPSAKESNQPGYFYDNFNAAMQLENGDEIYFYHKSKLVPGVEKLPFPQVFSFLAPVFKELGGSVSGWGWQEAPSVFYANSGIGVAPVICYESIWGDWIGQSVQDGAQFIAIITNDGWWGNTSGKDQHFLYAKLRAIETRRYVVRSANTGISGFINQKGDITAKTEWWVPTAIANEINLNDEMTFYVKNGDVIAKFFTFAAILFIGLLVYLKKIKRKS